MAINWSDPNLYVSGAGTALGALGGLFGFLNNANWANQAAEIGRRQQLYSQTQQAQALRWMQDREAALQAQAAAPYDIARYQNPMIANMTDAVRREALANSVSNSIPPDLAQKIFMTETLPKFSQNIYNDASQLAVNQRQQLLNAMAWIPSAQALAGNLNPGAADYLGTLRGPGNTNPFGGDVSALGSYLKAESTRQAQMEAQKAARESTENWYNRFFDLYGKNGFAVPGQTSPDSTSSDLTVTGNSDIWKGKDPLGEY